MLHGWFRESYPIRDQSVVVRLPAGLQAGQVRALRSGATLPHEQSGQTIEFVVPEIRDYEIVVI
jgi:hypothetical protein